MIILDTQGRIVRQDRPILLTSEAIAVPYSGGEILFAKSPGVVAGDAGLTFDDVADRLKAHVSYTEFGPSTAQNYTNVMVTMGGEDPETPDVVTGNISTYGLLAGWGFKSTTGNQQFHYGIYTYMGSTSASTTDDIYQYTVFIDGNYAYNCNLVDSIGLYIGNYAASDTGATGLAYAIWVNRGDVRFGSETYSIGNVNTEAYYNFNGVTTLTNIPSAAPVIGAGIDDGLHSYRYTYLTTAGETAANPTKFIFTAASPINQRNVSLPSAPAHIAAYVTDVKLYRTVAGDTGNHKLVATIAGTGGGTYTDSTPDASLGADLPAGLTIPSLAGRIDMADVARWSFASDRVFSAASATLRGIYAPPVTLTILGTTNITTATGFNYVEFGQPTLSNASLTVDRGATVYIANAPAVTGGMALTNAYALWVDAGETRLDGVLSLTDQNQIRFYEPTASGTNYSALRAQAQTVDITYTLPPAVVTDGFLKTDASGNLTWATSPPGGVGGSGTINTLAKWTASTTLGDSLFKDDGAHAALVGAIDGATYFNLDVTPAENDTSVNGIRISIISNPTGGINNTVTGFLVDYGTSSADSFNSIWGLRLEAYLQHASASANFLSAIEINFPGGTTGTTGNMYGIRIIDYGGTGTATNTYGIYIGDLTSGTQTSVYSFYSADSGAPMSHAGQMRLPTSGSSAGILIGGDVLLYHSAADMLRTPDSLTVDGFIRVGGSAASHILNVEQATTTGVTLYVNRNLTATSTDSAVAYFRQQHATDDQDTLFIEQAGSGYALNVNTGHVRLAGGLNGGGAAGAGAGQIFFGPSETPVVTSANFRFFTAGNSFAIFRNTSADIEVLLGVDGSRAVLDTVTNHPLHLLTNDTLALAIDTSQRVGIGTDTPVARLTVNGAVAILDGLAEPSTQAGWGQIYIDSADGDLKIKYGDGTVKLIVVDT